jgi:hypothetical protein
VGQANTRTGFDEDVIQLLDPWQPTSAITAGQSQSICTSMSIVHDSWRYVDADMIYVHVYIGAP